MEMKCCAAGGGSGSSGVHGFARLMTADSLSLVPMQFCGAIVLIFFLELAVAVLAFLFQDWVRDRFREFFESNIRSYRDDIDLQNLIDSLQKAVSSASHRPSAQECPLPPLVTLGCPAAEMGMRPSLLSAFSATAGQCGMEHPLYLWSAQSQFSPGPWVLCVERGCRG